MFFRSYLRWGDQLFHIEWTNPDGSPNVGTDIRLTVWHVNHSEPSITSGSVADGAADVDSDLLNRDGIRFDFDESVIDFGSQLAAEDGENLDWETVWGMTKPLYFVLARMGSYLKMENAI